jgi:hypothetical protein
MKEHAKTHQHFEAPEGAKDVLITIVKEYGMFYSFLRFFKIKWLNGCHIPQVRRYVISEPK